MKSSLRLGEVVRFTHGEVLRIAQGEIKSVLPLPAQADFTPIGISPERSEDLSRP